MEVTLNDKFRQGQNYFIELAQYTEVYEGSC